MSYVTKFKEKLHNKYDIPDINSMENVGSRNITNELLIMLSFFAKNYGELRVMILNLMGRNDCVGHLSILPSKDLNKLVRKIKSEYDEKRINKKRKPEEFELFCDNKAELIYILFSDTYEPVEFEPMETESDTDSNDGEFDGSQEERELDRTTKLEIKALKQTIRRRDQKITRLSGAKDLIKQNQDLQLQVDDLKKLLEKKELRLKNSKSVKDRYRKNLSNYKHKALALEVAKEKIKSLEKENKKLKNTQEQIVNLKDDNGIYKNSVVACIWELQSFNVSDRYIGNVISSVSKNIFDKHIDCVPSQSTIRRYAKAGALVARIHVSEELDQMISNPQQSKIALSSDETSKAADKFETFITSNEIKNLCMGVPVVSSKSGAVQLQTLKDLLDEIATFKIDLDQKTTAEDFTDSIVEAIQVLHGDRAKCQDKFNILFTEFRESVIKLKEEFKHLPEDEKANVLNVLDTNCQIHILSNMTLVVVESFRLHEIELERRSNSSNDKEPMVLKTIKQMSSLISQRSGGQAGILAFWKPWAQKNNIAKFMLPGFLGHRFNIVFESAEILNHIYPDFIKFVKETKLDSKPDIKMLIKNLEDPLIISHLKTLSFLNLTVCEPILHHAGKSRSMMETLKWLPPLYDWMIQTYDAIESVYEIEKHPMVGIAYDYERWSDRFNEIMLRDEINEDIGTALILALGASINHVSHFFKDYLPDGIYFEQQEKYKDILSVAPSNNNAAESVFGYLDWLGKLKPNMSHLRKEAAILINKNKTIKWLQALDTIQQDSLISECRSKSKDFAINFRKKMEVVQQEKLNKLRQETLERLEVERKGALRLDAGINNMISRGIWHYLMDIDQKLDEMPNDETRFKELSYQLMFRRIILKQKEPYNSFTCTFKGKRLSIEELKKKLINLFEKEEKLIKVSDKYVGKRINHRFLKEEYQEMDRDELEEEAYNVFTGNIVNAFKAKETDEPVYIMKYDNKEEYFAFPRQEINNQIIEQNLIFLD